MIEVVVGHKLVDRCDKFGNYVVASYRAGRKLASQKLSVPGKERIDGNTSVQSVGRMAEVALCIHLGANPLDALNWTARCDEGYDLKMQDGRTVDVKASSHPAARRLIWPVSKMHFIHKAADVLVFARVLASKASAMGQVVELVGWITRERFVKDKVIARCLPGIVDGTAYILDDALDNMELLSNNPASTKQHPK